MLELKNFITNTLVDIIEGVHDAKLKISSDKGYVTPPSSQLDTAYIRENIDFDIAVQVQESASSENKLAGKADLGGKIIVVSAKSQIAGEKTTQEEIGKESISRIKFSVRIGFKPSIPE